MDEITTIGLDIAKRDPMGVNSDRSLDKVESPTNSQEVRNASCSQP
jgi:hypothetical protein